MREVAFIGRDGAIIKQLTENDSAVDLSVVTRITLDLDNGMVIDSQSAPAVFDWSAGNGVVAMKLGIATIPAGSYVATLFVYDPSNPLGVAWGAFSLTMI